MPSPEQLRARLMKKLDELFQLDQPDLDFGFYRIMHSKSEEIRSFISNDLMKIVAEEFGAIDEAKKAALQEEYQKAFETARLYGSPNPDDAEPVRKAKAALDSIRDTSSAEADIYDHLYRFFERYYDDGDFISRRYHTRETSDKAAPFAIPYNGEEVKLHWANADQYYIKSTENFSNFTFDLAKAQEVRSINEAGLLGAIKQIPADESYLVHFKVVDASEGEHGDIKTAEASRRFFILDASNPVSIDDKGELEVHFEFRPDPERSGQDGAWREKRNAEAVIGIIARLEVIAASEGNFKERIAKYLELFKTPAPTDSDRKRILLAKYIYQYTARNTKDYFIHKDLKGFLSRELDFYIKNEVMRLDDIESASAQPVGEYLTRIKVLRKIARQLIDFLAQLEDFQKKLWLKKKFIVETNYCITLDQIPEDLYPEIATNEAQCDEWVKLFAINEIEADLHNPGYSKPLTIEFLRANDKLVLDTRFFPEGFKNRLISSIDNLDERCNGLMIHSENQQALKLLQKRYSDSIKAIYIDPPYNTAASEISYKNSYKHSSWLSLINNALHLAKPLLDGKSGILCCTIDDYEQKVATYLIESIFGEIAGTVVIRIKPSGRPIPNGFAVSHEYAIFAKTDKSCAIERLDYSEEQRSRYGELDSRGPFFWESFRKAGSNTNRSDRPTMFYPFYFNKNTQKLRLPRMKYDENTMAFNVYEEPLSEEAVILPMKDDGSEGRWYFGLERASASIDEFIVKKQENGELRVYYRRRQNEGVQPTTIWTDSKYSATEHGTGLLKAIFGKQEVFTYPKSLYAVMDCLSVAGVDDSPNCAVLDFFAGSGTTGHAVISMNRKDNEQRKFILVEMGSYFDIALKPRIIKSLYSMTWKDGKPLNRTSGMSGILKYFRLESYEDTLNNLSFNSYLSPAIESSHSLRKDYLLRYFLDVETRGSQSLLNIDAFSDPTSYKLKVKRPGSDEYVENAVDLVETFNYLIGLRVKHIEAPQTFRADFVYEQDTELPSDHKPKLAVDGGITEDPKGPWWFRKVEGWVPKDPANPKNGQKERIIIVWRRLTGDIEKDNLVLDQWFKQACIKTGDNGFDVVYVNGSSTLANLKQDVEGWEVRLLEKEFMKRMWEVEA